MKILKSQSVRMCALAAAMAAGFISCSSEDPITTGSGSVPNAQNTPTSKVHENSRSDGGTTFQRDDGWPIPSFGEAIREEFSTSVVTSSGRSVKVQLIVIQTDPLSLIIDNPLYFNGTGLENVRVNKVKEYRTPAGVFCYRFLVNDAEVDKNTNEVLSTKGYLYSYSYYDENGDGEFESLVVSEKDRNGLKGPQNEPHIPDWAITKTDEGSTPHKTSTSY